jgi:hypothetical protein
MAKSSFRERIPVIAGAATYTAARVATAVRHKCNNQFGTRFDNGLNANSLQIKSLADKLFDKHGFLLQIEMVGRASITT